MTDEELTALHTASRLEAEFEMHILDHLYLRLPYKVDYADLEDVDNLVVTKGGQAYNVEVNVTCWPYEPYDD